MNNIFNVVVKLQNYRPPASSPRMFSTYYTTNTASKTNIRINARGCNRIKDIDAFNVFISVLNRNTSIYDYH